MKRGNRIMLAMFILMLAAYACVLADRYYFAGRGDLRAQIIQNGKTVATVKLEEPEELRIESPYGGYNVVRFEKGKVAITDADCMGRDCVKRGWLELPGESAICLPHRLEIRVSGEPLLDGATY